MDTVPTVVMEVYHPPAVPVTLIQTQTAPDPVHRAVAALMDTVPTVMMEMYHLPAVPVTLIRIQTA